MGSSHSVQSRDERRRSNRLSKPPTKNATISPTNPISPCQASAVTTDALPWQNPWTGTTIPVSPSVHDHRAQRSQSFPSRPPQSEAPWGLANEVNESCVVFEETDESSPQSPCTDFGSSISLSRRTSARPSRQALLRPATLHSYHHLSYVQSVHPTRSYSMHTLPGKAKDCMHDRAFEEAASSNTHFMVDNQGFSLMRRRSLLTKPGVATRRSVKGATIGRLPPSIDQGYEHSFSHMDSQLRDQDVVCTQSPTQVRPPTPTGSEYTHLGNLKLGSLRVVNGSVSPSPSERSRLDEARSPTTGPDENAVQSAASWHNRDVGQNNADASATSESPENATLRSVRRVVEECLQDASEGQPVKKPLASLLRIPSLSDSKKLDDFPASPFSFEKSPINIYPHGQDPYLFSKEIDDEGISVPDDGEIFDHQAMPTATEKPGTMRSPRLHRKADSGYSSATSVRSLQDGRSRASIDSQASRRHSPDYHPFALGDTAKTFQIREEPGNQLIMRRHVSLQGHRASLMAEASTSTMCHEPQETSSYCRSRSSSYSVPQNPNRTYLRTHYCAQLRNIEPIVNRTPHSSIRQMGHSGMEAARGVRNRERTAQSSDPRDLSGHSELDHTKEVVDDLRFQSNRLLRSASESNFAHDRGSRSASTRATGPKRKAVARIWSQRPGIEAPPLPVSPISDTFKSSAHQDRSVAASEPARCPGQSRDIELQHRRLVMVKPHAQKRSDIYLATSPFIFT
ncbi:hypothetical protein CNMCM8980_009645 [Aspergillus fumigatiaffinis]|jgi:hypothetical protein|uniref:Uncharacterized protein n=1 Tax=Aspergillus fumigatiaffinis TaxID=340414 RepID=A0A8H4MGS8_9EURO|nr:hypothetical protein CNMCM5878_009949 [Aspergillus fumigatiaffinis]KAF4231633.1 hypothetical protein CNMCM6457_005256 [Aspergillus fumigatiaffinis]KAF4243282.1 hypothetical protein CNMCM6805_001291 [Aspergillus fumigatiaffinis]KAF4251006.1 hypothetical protein CNMCM8980_009645 [Aspergillus fumigatiaffinis]